MAEEPRSLETFLNLNYLKLASSGSVARRSKQSEAATAEQPQHLHRAASVKKNNGSNGDAQHGASVRSHAGQRHRQSPDLYATELSNLETLLTIDSNFPFPSRTPTYDHLKTGGLSSGPEVTPKQDSASSKKPQDPSLRHVQGTGVEFDDLSFSVLKRQRKKNGIMRDAHLLRGITGVASKGELTAVMGPTGAGKSTLVDALAGRIDCKSLGGFIMVNGRPVNATLMKKISAYVTQNDQLFPMLTVWETLSFAAELRLNRGLSFAEKRDRVVKVIDQLGLTHVQSRYIGDEKTRGIFRGEKRLVSIGVDIIHNPSLLFMDDPTSGLDYTSAYNVVEKVRDIAKTESCTVILTIHRPSSRIVQLLDRLIILARGQLIYQGGPNYLSTHLAGFGLEVPRGESPIEYFLDVVKEYDKSVSGVEPLVRYNFDGTKLSTDDQQTSRGTTRTQSEDMQSSHQFEDRSRIPEKQSSTSPLEHQSKLFRADDRGRTFKPDDHDVEARVEAMEVGNRPNEDFDNAFDHSLTREAPKLASQFYRGVLAGLADRFLIPRASPGSPRQSTSSMYSTPMSTAAPSPDPTQRTPTGPLQKFPFDRKTSRTPLRSPSMKDSPKNTSESHQFPQNYTGTSEISPATSTPTQRSGTTATPILSSSDCTVTEQDYRILHYMPEWKFANLWWREVAILMIRNLKNLQRTPELFMLRRQLTLTIMGLVMATSFVKARHHLTDLNGVASIMSFFVVTVCIFFFSINSAIPAFITERFIFIRETSHNAYRASSSVIASAIVSLPLLAIQSFTYVLITWWALGFQRTGGSFFFFYLILFVSLLCASSFAMFVSSIVPNHILGYAVFIAVTSLYFLTCGFLIHRNNIPVYWVWLHYISALKYPYEAMLLNEFGDGVHDQLSCYFRDPSGQCSLTGKSLLESLGVTELTKWESLVVLLIMAVFYRVLFYCVLRCYCKKQRTRVQ